MQRYVPGVTGGSFPQPLSVLLFSGAMSQNEGRSVGVIRIGACHGYGTIPSENPGMSNSSWRFEVTPPHELAVARSLQFLEVC